MAKIGLVINLLQLAIGLALLIVIADGDARGSLFHDEQLVRVYGPTGQRLFVGTVAGEAAPYVTICKIILPSTFKPHQCIVVDTRGSFILADANEPGVRYVAKRRR